MRREMSTCSMKHVRTRHGKDGVRDDGAALGHQQALVPVIQPLMRA